MAEPNPNPTLTLTLTLVLSLCSPQGLPSQQPLQPSPSPSPPPHTHLHPPSPHLHPHPGAVVSSRRPHLGRGGRRLLVDDAGEHPPRPPSISPSPPPHPSLSPSPLPLPSPPHLALAPRPAPQVKKLVGELSSLTCRILMTCPDNFGEASLHACTVADAYRELRPCMRFDEAAGGWRFSEPVTRRGALKDARGGGAAQSREVKLKSKQVKKDGGERTTQSERKKAGVAERERERDMEWGRQGQQAAVRQRWSCRRWMLDGSVSTAERLSRELLLRMTCG